MAYYKFVKKYSPDLLSIGVENKLFALDLKILNNHSIPELLNIFSIYITKKGVLLYINYSDDNGFNYTKLLNIETLKNYKNIISALSIIFHKEKLINKKFLKTVDIENDLIKFLDENYEALPEELKTLKSSKTKINYNFFKVYPLYFLSANKCYALDLNELNSLSIPELLNIFTLVCFWNSINIKFSENNTAEFNIDRVEYLKEYNNIINALAFQYQTSKDTFKDKLPYTYRVLFEKTVESLPDDLKLLLKLKEFT